MLDIPSDIDPILLDPRHKWVIDGVSLQYIAPGADAYLFAFKGSTEELEGKDVPYKLIKKSDLVELMREEHRWKVSFNYYTDRNITRRRTGLQSDITEVSNRVRDKALLAYGIFKNADDLRRKHPSPDSVEAKSEAMLAAWKDHVAQTEAFNRDNPDKTRSLIWKGCPCVGTFDNWSKRIEQFGDTPSALIDGRHANSGNHNPKLTEEQERIITLLVHDYFDERAPSIAAQLRKCVTLVAQCNKEIEKHNARSDLGPNERLPLVQMPGDKAFYRRFNGLSPYLVKVMRYGFEKADAMYHSTGTGNLQFRPGMWTEGDTWICDLQVLLEQTTAWKTLTPKERKKAKSVRLRVMVTLDVATDSITAIGVSWSENVEIAIETVRMTVEDKTDFAKAIGCKTPWPMYGAHNFIVDNASVFGDPSVRAVALEAIGGFQRSVVGRPWLRAKVERFFRTLAEMLLSYFTGRTFSNVVQLEGRNPQERASMFAMELRTQLIKWVVDGYHNQKVRRLGMTPYQAWLRLSELAPPPPPLSRERVSYIFADKMECSVSGEGVRVANEYYNSEQLNALFKLCGRRKLQVKVDWQDLGHVLVRVPEKFQSLVVNAIDLDEDRGRWIVVPGPEAWRGASLWQLLEASRKLDDMFSREAKLGQDAWVEIQLALMEAGQEAIVRRGLNTRPTANEVSRAMKGFHPGLHHLKREMIAARHDMDELHAAIATGAEPLRQLGQLASVPALPTPAAEPGSPIVIYEEDEDEFWDDEKYLALEAEANTSKE